MFWRQTSRRSVAFLSTAASANAVLMNEVRISPVRSTETTSARCSGVTRILGNRAVVMD
jgi:hypothetical protein